MRLPTRLELILIILLMGAIAVAFFGWRREVQPAATPAPGYRVAPPEKPVQKLVKKPIRAQQAAPLLAYDKENVTDQLGIPEFDALADLDKEVIASADIPPSPAGTSAITVYDVKTGDSDILIKAKPLPFIDLQNHGEIGVRWGISTDSLQRGTLYLSWRPLRVGEAQLTLYGEATANQDEKAEGLVGAGLSRGW